MRLTRIMRQVEGEKGEFHSLKGSLLPKICNCYVLSVLIAKGFLNEHQLLGLGLSNSSDVFLT